jgi:hypothetical protein
MDDNLTGIEQEEIFRIRSMCAAVKVRGPHGCEAAA